MELIKYARSIVIGILLCVRLTAVAGMPEADISKVIERPGRPLLLDFLKEVYPGRTIEEIFRDIRNLSDADVHAKSNALINKTDIDAIVEMIVLLEKNFPGATLAFLGRDSVAAYEIFMAYYASRGQFDRVVRVDASTASVLSGPEDILAKFIFQRGLNPQKIASGHPYLLIDTTSYSSDSQSHVLMSAVYLALQRMGISTEMLNSKFNFISLNRGKIALSQDSYKVVAAMSRKMENGLPIPLDVITAVMPMTYTAEWQGSYGVLTQNQNGQIVANLGASTDRNAHVEIAKKIVSVAQIFGSNYFHKLVETRAKDFDIERNLTQRAPGYSKYELALKVWLEENDKQKILKISIGSEKFQSSSTEGMELFKKSLHSIFEDVPPDMEKNAEHIVTTIVAAKKFSEWAKSENLSTDAITEIESIHKTAFQDLLLLSRHWDLKIRADVNHLLKDLGSSKIIDDKKESALILSSFLAASDKFKLSLIDKSDLAMLNSEGARKDRRKELKSKISTGLKRMTEPLDTFDLPTSLLLGAVSYYLAGSPIQEFIFNPSVGLNFAELKPLIHTAWISGGLYLARMHAYNSQRKHDKQRAARNEILLRTGYNLRDPAPFGRLQFTNVGVKAEPPVIDVAGIKKLADSTVTDKIQVFPSTDLKTRDQHQLNSCLGFY